jgi:hypothetical protein
MDTTIEYSGPCIRLLAFTLAGQQQTGLYQMESEVKKQRTTNITREAGKPLTTAPSPVGTRAEGGATMIMTPAAAAATTDPPTRTTTRTTIKIPKLTIIPRERRPRLST